MTWKHWAARNNYGELAHFFAEELEENDLKYHLEVLEKNATYLSVAMFDELQLAIDKHIETGMPMQLSLVNEFTLGADDLTSMSDTPELNIFIKYVNPITNTLCDRFLCLVPLVNSKSTSALHEAIVKVFSDGNLNMNIFFNAFDGTNTMSGSIGVLQRHMCFKSLFLKYISYRSHHFNLVFVHLTQIYEVLGELDSLLLQLWKKTKFSTTNKSFLEEI